jgi:hypothetical protein
VTSYTCQRTALSGSVLNGMFPHSTRGLELSVAPRHSLRDNFLSRSLLLSPARPPAHSPTTHAHIHTLTHTQKVLFGAIFLLLAFGLSKRPSTADFPPRGESLDSSCIYILSPLIGCRIIPFFLFSGYLGALCPRWDAEMFIVVVSVAISVLGTKKQQKQKVVACCFL